MQDNPDIYNLRYHVSHQSPSFPMYFRLDNILLNPLHTIQHLISERILVGLLSSCLEGNKRTDLVKLMQNMQRGDRSTSPLFLHETALHEAHRPSRRNLMTGELPQRVIHRQTPWNTVILCRLVNNGHFQGDMYTASKRGAKYNSQASIYLTNSIKSNWTSIILSLLYMTEYNQLRFYIFSVFIGYRTNCKRNGLRITFNECKKKRKQFLNLVFLNVPLDWSHVQTCALPGHTVTS